MIFLKSKAFFFLLIAPLVAFSNINKSELNIPSKEDILRTGSSTNDLAIKSSQQIPQDIQATTKKEEPVQQKEKPIKSTPKPTAQAAPQEDLSKAYILSKIQSNKALALVTPIGAPQDFIALPATPQSNYAAPASQDTQTTSNDQNTKYEYVEAKCYTDKEYNIFGDGKLTLYCNTKGEQSEEIRVSALIKITTDKLNPIKATPYRYESVKKGIVNLDTTQSRLFHGISGSENLSTFVDKRAAENITKEMANAAGTAVPQNISEYVKAKNTPNSTVSQTDSSTVTSTTTPTPDITDYGIAAIVEIIAAGSKAAANALYADLPYIYFIPMGTPIDAELYVLKEEK